jgi:Transposase DDE domain
MVSIDTELGVIRSDPLHLLDSQHILELCREAGYRPEADGKLDPATLISLFIRQIAAGNLSCDAVRIMGYDTFSISGYCQARMRLPLAVLKTLAREMYQKLSGPLDREEQHRWHGHRVLLMDSTTFSMPDTPPLRRFFGQHGGQEEGCGFPIAHQLLLFNARTGLVVDAITAPLRTHEMSKAAGTHERMAAGDLVVGDDSFGTYAHLALLSQRGMHGLFPAHHARIVDFTLNRPCIEPLRKAQRRGGVTAAAAREAFKDAGRLPRSRWLESLGQTDQLVEWLKPDHRPRWMSAAQWKQIPAKLTVREIRRTLTRPGFRPVTLTIVTTLLDPGAYPAEELFTLRLRRWDVETDIRHLKTSMGMEILHCQSVEGVQKELWVFLLIYNLLRVTMAAAAKRQTVDVSRISFQSALNWFRIAIAGDPLLTLAVVPYRPNRIEPRVLKRRPKPYPLMMRPRSKLKEEMRAAMGVLTGG